MGGMFSSFEDEQDNNSINTHENTAPTKKKFGTIFTPDTNNPSLWNELLQDLKNDSLNSFFFHYCHSPLDEQNNIYWALKANKSLTAIFFKGSTVTGTLTSDINSLIGHPNIELLQLYRYAISQTEMTNECVDALRNLLATNKSLTTLQFWNVDIGHASINMHPLCRAIAESNTLSSLEFLGVEFSPKNLCELVLATICNSSLKSISCDNYGPGDGVIKSNTDTLLKAAMRFKTEHQELAEAISYFYNKRHSIINFDMFDINACLNDHSKLQVCITALLIELHKTSMNALINEQQKLLPTQQKHAFNWFKSKKDTTNINHSEKNKKSSIFKKP